MDKMKLHSPDLSQENIAKIREIFPGCVTEAADANGNLRLAVDIEKLRQELSDHVIESGQERYQLDWPGKREALFAANAPIAKTLRPVYGESVDFETTRNLFIEGDNLEALKLLQETYLGKIKLIYIDPPYNTGSDLLYEDDFAEDNENYLVRSNQRDEDGNRLTANNESNGRFHSDWLSSIYARLRLAHRLLSSDGAIVVHIDENEYCNLEKVLSEIFGEQNNLGTIVWDKRNPKGDAAGVAQQHELICIYCRNKDEFKEKVDFRRPKENAEKMMEKVATLIKANGKMDDKVREEYKIWLSKQDVSGGEKAHNLIDDAGEIYQSVSMAWPNKKNAPDDYKVPLIHPDTGKPCAMPERGWRNPSKTMQKLLQDNLILFGQDHTTQPRRKYLLRDNTKENIPSVLYYGGSDDKFFQEINIAFDNPKPLKVAKGLIRAICEDSDFVLDCYAGSGTAAHAVLALNAEDGKNRQFILAQIDEKVEEDSEAFNLGFMNIAELTRERIKRATPKILEGQCHADWNRDVGFRVLKIDTSNIEDVYYRPDDVTQENLLTAIDNIKPDRKPEDLLFQVLVDWGVDLTLPISRKDVQGKSVFFVDENAMAACFETGITEAFVKELAEHKPIRVVFRDNGFASDAVKINVEQIFRQISPTTEIRSI